MCIISYRESYGMAAKLRAPDVRQPWCRNERRFLINFGVRAWQTPSNASSVIIIVAARYIYIRWLLLQFPVLHKQNNTCKIVSVLGLRWRSGTAERPATMTSFKWKRWTKLKDHIIIHFGGRICMGECGRNTISLKLKVESVLQSKW